MMFFLVSKKRGYFYGNYMYNGRMVLASREVYCRYFVSVIYYIQMQSALILVSRFVRWLFGYLYIKLQCNLHQSILRFIFGCI